VIIFVSGKKSSNGKALYATCKSVNERSYFISGKEELDQAWLAGATSVGVCGATSTPMWLMEEVAEAIQSPVGV
jgi:4-hydroxy-3-methylbut-2-enyl diphosphate reductase